MSLKITVEVDGQSEQQMMPVVAQFVAWQSAQSKAQAFAEETADSSSSRLSSRLDCDLGSSALLQQQIHLLAQQNQLLQAQLGQHQQQLLAGVPAAKALPQALPAASVLSAEVAIEADTPSPIASTPPRLPAQYQMSKGIGDRHRLGRWLRRRWRQRAAYQRRLLLFLLLCGLAYGALSWLPQLVEQLWETPEFVESADSGPGSTTTAPESQQNNPPKNVQPTAPSSPTSKAGSHPPPPPAFEQP